MGTNILLLPASKRGGRPRSVDLRAILNAIFYIVVAGCAWRMLPKDLPKWKTVYHYFRAWRLDGTWEQIHSQFVQWERVAQHHEPVLRAWILNPSRLPRLPRFRLDSMGARKSKDVNAI